MAGTSVSFDAIRQAVLDFYAPDSDIWRKINYGTATEAEVLRAYSYVPQMQLSRSSDGSRILGYDYSTGLNQLAYYDDYLLDEIEKINSNAGPGAYSSGNGFYVRLPADWTGQSGQDLATRAGTTIRSSGQTLATIADRASLAVAGANFGTKLGCKIDELLYSIDPQWWDTHYPSINPQTWPTMVESEGGKTFVRTLFGIPENGPATAYMPADVMAQTYMLLRDSGAFSPGETTADYTGDTSQFPQPTLTHVTPGTHFYTITGSGAYAYRYDYICDKPNTYFVNKQGTRILTIAKTANSSYRIVMTRVETGEILSDRRVNIDGALTTYNGTPYYSANIGLSTMEYVDIPVTNITNDRQIGTILIDGTITTTSPVDGITPLPSDRAPYGIPSPSVITGTTIDEVLEQLRENYPFLFDGSIYSDVLQDDGTISHDEYVPIPLDTSLDDEQVTTGDSTQTQTQVDDETMVDIATSDPTDNPPDTGTGEQSPFVMPVGNASSLWAVYHPSQAELNAFGAWLWSSDFVEQLKRLFNDPMQAIIGVHKVFAPIPTGGTQTIKCGYLDSGVSSPTVSNQYTEVNCGTVNCREYFGNVFDYDPHTKVSIYLPFIGVVPLKVSEVMRASINVTYGVDVITGACLAKVKVERDGGGAILYSYGGSCACHYPISSGSYAGIISGIVTSAIGIAGGIATGNPLSAVGGAVAGLHQAHTDVQRSGGFTGCAGAMGPKKPYLIIDRPQTRLANDFAAYDGKPANSTQFIGDCVGFIRAQEVHFSAPGAFDDEAKEVESLLKSGVLMN